MGVDAMPVFPGYSLLGKFGNANFVAVLQSRFEAEGIDVVVLDDGFSGWYSFAAMAGTFATVRVFVRDEQLEQARGIIEAARGFGVDEDE